MAPDRHRFSQHHWCSYCLLILNYSSHRHIALSVASLSPLPSCTCQLPHLLCGKLPCTNLVGHAACSTTTTTPPLTQPARAAGAGRQTHGHHTPSARNPCRVIFVCFSLLHSPYFTDPIGHTPSCHPQPPPPHHQTNQLGATVNHLTTSTLSTWPPPLPFSGKFHFSPFSPPTIDISTLPAHILLPHCTWIPHVAHSDLLQILNHDQQPWGFSCVAHLHGVCVLYGGPRREGCCVMDGTHGGARALHQGCA